MKERRAKGFLKGAVTAVSLLASVVAAQAAVEKVICVPWQGDVDKQHTALSGAAAQLKGVVKTTDTSPVYVKWVFGDGSESPVTTLSGRTSYPVSTAHLYTAASGTPFTAMLQVSNTNPFAMALEDSYRLKIEDDTQDARINISIDKGLWYLYQQGNNHGYSSYGKSYDGSRVMTWAQSGWVYTLVTPTASAVHAFGINGHKLKGNPEEDPYVEAVQLGMNYIVKGYNYYMSYPALHAYQISGTADVNQNGYGIETYDWGGNHTPYQAGQIMDAIIASGAAPTDSTGRDFSRNDNTMGKNWTYGELLQDMADMHSWGQYDGTSCNGGICGSWWYNWNYGWPGDNSASQWAAIGMLPAQQPPWNVVVPGWVKSYNANWLEYSKYNPGGNQNLLAFGYNHPNQCAGDSCLQTTTSGMVQMIFDGQGTSDPKWGPAQRYIADNWKNFTHDGSGWGGLKTYGWYSFAKAMRLSLPDPTTQLVKSSSASFDWYYGNPNNATCTTEANCEKGLAQRIVETQGGDGGWNIGNFTNPPLTTAWMIITLKPTLFEASPVACFAVAPNPSYPDQNIAFDPACSGHSETGKGIANLVKFEWDWDNDGSYDTETGAPAVVSHPFACTSVPCYNPVKLRVTDDSTPARSATAIVTVNITNPPHPPVAEAGGPYVASTCGTDSLKLDGSRSFDQDQGEREAGCTTCAADGITAYQWDLKSPLTFDVINATGATPTVSATDIAALIGVGTKNIGLRVADNTLAAYPGSGQQNLTHADFATVEVSTGCLCTLAARAKTGMVQLSWAAAEHSASTTYNIYRSTTGPNSGFTKIRSGYTNAYPLFVDSGLSNGTTYYYRVEKMLSSGSCGSKAVSGKPVAL